jgi:glucose-6-phosphate dehydrogenase assembly protein OpcA
MSDSETPTATAEAILEKDTVQAVSGQESDPISLEDVEAELSRRIRALQTSPEEMILPVRMSNLLIWCDNPALAEQVTAMVPDILSQHPARVILLVGNHGEGPDEIITTVTVRVHPVKSDRVLCSEQITLRARGMAVARLPYVVYSLLVGDLPINLWWAAPVPPPLGGEFFHELGARTDLVVFDSIGWPDPPRGVLAVANWIGNLEKTTSQSRWRLGADLNWRRLKYWRRLLTQALDPAVAPGFLPTISEVTLEHGPHAVVQAWELLSWLASRLGWRVQAGKVQPGVELSWQFNAPHGKVRVRICRMEDGLPVIYRMRIAGPNKVLSFTVGSERRLAVFDEGTRSAPRTLSVQPTSLAELVGRELSDRDYDRVFRDSLEVARVLAQSVMH